jgi:hypothetical protein
MRAPSVALEVVASFVVLGSAFGSQIHVPADFPTIQQAIDAAVDGDSILVEPATYTESIDFLGKAVSVSANSADPTLTVLVAAAASPAVFFRNDEPSESLLANFTLTGGSGVLLGGQTVGGNLFVSHASPTLRNLVVRDNFGVGAGGGAWFDHSSSLLDSVQFLRCRCSASGGGLHAIGSSLVIEHGRFEQCFSVSVGGGLNFEDGPFVQLEDCSILDCQASDSAGLRASKTSLEISGCHFEGNDADEGSGGGMGLESCDGLVTNCTLEDNTAGLGFGGGIVIRGDTPIAISGCEFRSNWASEHGSHLGVENSGGVVGPTITGCRGSNSRDCVYVTGAALFEQDDFAGVLGSGGENSVVVIGPGPTRFVDVALHEFDTGVLLDSTDLVSLERCRITDLRFNALEAYRGAGVVRDCQLTGCHLGVYCEDASLQIDGCTISGNSNPFNFPGGIGALGSSVVTVRDSIVHGNDPVEILDSTSGGMTVEFCDVRGGWAGTGNLDADPLFRDAAAGDFTLKESSPCIDAGDPTITTTRRDLFGRPRRLDGHLSRAERLDVGAFEFGQLTLSIGGDARPGGTITVGTAGNCNLAVFLLVGLDAAELDHPFLGTLYVDFASAWSLIPWGHAPSLVPVRLPGDITVPLSVHVQEVGLLSKNGAGVTSNDVVVIVQ